MSQIRLDLTCCEKGFYDIPFKDLPNLLVTALQASNHMQVGETERGGERFLQLSFWLVNFSEVVAGFESSLFN